MCEQIMDVVVMVIAAVLKHVHPVVAIRGVANGRETTPLVVMPARISVSIFRSRSRRSKSVVENAPTRVLRTIRSPGSGATASCMAVSGASSCMRRPAATPARPLLVSGMAA